MTRFECLNELLNYERPIDLISQRLTQFEWDYEGEPLLIKSSHVLNALLRYVDGDISALELENWANLIEGREDLDFDSICAEELESILHSLANPILEGAIDKQQCITYIDKLRNI